MENMIIKLQQEKYCVFQKIIVSHKVYKNMKDLRKYVIKIWNLQKCKEFF